MTSEPLPAECAERQRRLAEGDPGRELLDHMAGCQSCSAFAAALVELEARLTRLPWPEPPAGAADRAVARFRAELAGRGSLRTAPLAPPPSQASPARPHRAGQASRRLWRPAISLAAGIAAAIALVVVLVTVLGPGSTSPAYAAILHEAAVHTGAEKSARFDITGSIGLSLHGQKLTEPVSGTGATEFPDRGELTEVATVFGRQLKQDIVSVGDRVWSRVDDGQWALIPIPPDHASAVDQALAYPARALDDLTRVGSGYRSLGTTTVGGTRVRQIQLTIPAGSFHAFGDLTQKVSRWRVVVDVSQHGLVLRRLTIAGHGVVSVLNIKVPFTYFLQLTLHDFGARVSIVPPGTGLSRRCARCKRRSTSSPSAVTPAARTGSATGAPGSGSTQPGSLSPSPGGGSTSPSPGRGSTSPSPGGGSTSPSPGRSTSPSPHPASSSPPARARVRHDHIGSGG
jgi:hypothetical protein